MLYKKSCPNCHEISYNRCDFGTWLCPSCKQDLSNEDMYDVETGKQIRPRLYLIKKSSLQKNPQLASQMKPYQFKSFD